MDNLYPVNVSSLEVRSEPDIQSKVYLKRDTPVYVFNKAIKYQSKNWTYIKTSNSPIISGYVLKRFLKKI